MYFGDMSTFFQDLKSLKTLSATSLDKENKHETVADHVHLLIHFDTGILHTWHGERPKMVRFSKNIWSYGLASLIHPHQIVVKRGSQFAPSTLDSTHL